MPKVIEFVRWLLAQESIDRAGVKGAQEAAEPDRFRIGYNLGRAHAWTEAACYLMPDDWHTVAKDGRGKKRPKQSVARRAGNKKTTTKVRLTGQDSTP